MPTVQRSFLSHVDRKRLTDNELLDLQKELITKDHTIPLDELCEKLNTDRVNGLTEEQAQNILLEKGPNALTPPKVTPEYIKFMKCMFHGFASLMWVCSALCFILYGISVLAEDTGSGIEWVGLIITCTCLISGVFAYVQESKNLKVSEAQQPQIHMAFK